MESEFLRRARAGGKMEQKQEGRKMISHLPRGSEVTGELAFQGSAEIDGTVEGDVLCDGMLIIGERAQVRGKISGAVIVIRGKVEGDLVANGKVEMEPPARLLGVIRPPVQHDRQWI